MQSDQRDLLTSLQPVMCCLIVESAEVTVDRCVLLLLLQLALFKHVQMPALVCRGLSFR